MADIKIYCMVKKLKSGYFDGINPHVTSDFPELEKIYDHVRTLPEVIGWYEREKAAKAKKKRKSTQYGRNAKKAKVDA